MGQNNMKTGHKKHSMGQKAMGHSRARTPLRGMSHLSHGTQMHGTRDTVVVGQDRASTPLRTPSHPTATTDPRFAGWIAGATAEQIERVKLQYERRLSPEQQELHRLCGERILKEHAARGRKFTADVLADAKRWAAFPKLPHALTNGEPLPEALRGDNLEVF